ncbi:putative methyltransferase At1g22800 [Tetrabaena socialis]|uniref:Putative methyltransferase At1g22800 n=1 Tax=Tetrabaena socialis TaxID=47790 RepID=A0A2J8AET9_9CHLO|nr:putative methyltransferase At1g22800 [Tetrabaena socialis]|eukprot:PNH11022.1 putative methyltransferase At1g22800 [Tetrabaena socialis]
MAHAAAARAPAPRPIQADTTCCANRASTSPATSDQGCSTSGAAVVSASGSSNSSSVSWAHWERPAVEGGYFAGACRGVVRYLHGGAAAAPMTVRQLHRGINAPPPSPLRPALSSPPRRAAAAAAAAAPAAGAPPRDVGLGSPMEVFDRPLKALHRDRSALLLDGADPLLGAVAERLLDRLEDCRRTFPTAVVLGGAAVPVVHQLAGGRAGIERIVVVDPSQRMLDRIRDEEREARARAAADPSFKAWPRMLYVRGDEESLPLRPQSVDLIISCLGLHWANDLPGAMAQCRRALLPDGLFLSALLGGETLQTAAVYQALFGNSEDGSVTATYEVIFMTGWSPSASQPKAAKRGSATVSFQDLADGLVQGGGAIGGTAEGEIVGSRATPAGAAAEVQAAAGEAPAAAGKGN